MKIAGVEVTNMNDYISRDDLLELYTFDDPVLNETGHVPLPVIRQNIMDMPAADVVDVVRKPVLGYEGYYEVDQFGRVFSVCRTVHVNDNGRIYDKPIRGKILKQTNHSEGYKTVALTKNGETKQEYVHRIVAAAFIPNPDNLPAVNHKDEDKTNNFVDNLEWCTTSYNNTYGTKTKRQAEKVKGKPHSEEHKGKISSSLIKYYETHISACKGMKSPHRKPVAQLDKAGNEIKHYSSITEATNGDISRVRNITAVCNGKRKTAYGFVWKWDKEEEHEQID